MTDKPKRRLQSNLKSRNGCAQCKKRKVKVRCDSHVFLLDYVSTLNLRSSVTRRLDPAEHVDGVEKGVR